MDTTIGAASAAGRRTPRLLRGRGRSTARHLSSLRLRAGGPRRAAGHSPGSPASCPQGCPQRSRGRRADRPDRLRGYRLPPTDVHKSVHRNVHTPGQGFARQRRQGPIPEAPEQSRSAKPRRSTCRAPDLDGSELCQRTQWNWPPLGRPGSACPLPYSLFSRLGKAHKPGGGASPHCQCKCVYTNPVILESWAKGVCGSVFARTSGWRGSAKS